LVDRAEVDTDHFGDLVGVSLSCDRCDLQLDAPFDGPFWLRVPEQVYIAIAVWIARSADNNTVARRVLRLPRPNAARSAPVSR
jgi:hypothetical protein